MTPRRLRSIALCGALVFTASAPIAVATLPTADHLDPALKRVANALREVIPEGWSFFTKSPREPFVEAETPQGVSVSTAPNAQPRWAFGWNRASRQGGIDIERLLAALDDEAWARCEPSDSPRDCTTRATQRIVRVDGLSPDLCQQLVLKRVTPTPWAFRDHPSHADEHALVDVRCFS